MKFKIKYIDQIVGILSFVALTALIILLLAISTKQRWFSRKYYFFSEFQSAEYISEGMYIKFRGFNIGKLKKIILTDDNTVHVRLFIYHNYYDIVKTGSIVDLFISPIGLGNQLHFYEGNGKELIPEGSLIPERNSKEAKLLISENFVNLPKQEDTITTIVHAVSSLLNNVNDTIMVINKTVTNSTLEKIIMGLGDTLGNTSTITNQLKSFSNELANPTGLLPRLLESDGSINKLFNDNASLYNSIIESLQTVEISLKNLNSISGDVNDITGSVKDELPQISLLLMQLQSTLLDAQNVLEGLKNNPLLKGGITEKPEAQGVSPQIRSDNF